MVASNARDGVNFRVRLENDFFQYDPLISYTAYQLKKFEIALEAAKKAAEFPEGAKDGNAMVKALEGIMQDREARKNKS